MNYETQVKVFEDVVEEMKIVLFKKGNDYATSSDRLSNFKLAGTICGTTPELNCLNLIGTKVARLGVLLNSGKEPSNEAVIDSVKDLIGYAFLEYMILIEKQDQI